MKYFKAPLIFILLVTITSEIVAQQTCSDPQDIIPVGRQVYMIGEVHLDQDGQSPENIAMISRTAFVEDSIRKYLVNQCGVNHFLLELPNCYGYFVRQYITTGDTSWIYFLGENNYYYYSRLKNLRYLNELKPGLRATCVDVNYAQNTNRTIFALLTLTFYDHYTKVYYPPYNDIKVIPVSADLNVAISIMKTDTNNIKPSTRIFFKELIKLVIMGDDADTLFYDLLVKTNSDQLLMKELKTFYGTGWEEVELIIDSYMYGFNIKKLDLKNLLAREPKFFGFSSEIIEHSPGDVYCLQLGDAHLDNDPEKNMMRQRITNKFGWKPFCIHLVPQTSAARLERINKLNSPYDFNFLGPSCIYSLTDLDINVLIH
ncbi:MAG: hypothetical protein ACHQFW_07385 [Chitinophagales bacterium]